GGGGGAGRTPAAPPRQGGPRQAGDRTLRVQGEPCGETMKTRNTATVAGELRVDNAFQPGWALRLGPLRLRSVPWYWAVLRDRLREAAARPRSAAPAPAHHDHYCEACDHRSISVGHMCAYPWAFPCGSKRHGGIGTERDQLDSWLILVRGHRTDLRRHLGESFKADPRVTVVLDRRRTDRRTLSAPGGALTFER